MLPILHSVRFLRASISAALLMVSTACDTPEPEIRIRMLANEEVIDEGVSYVAFGVQVTHTFVGETIPVEGAEVVFSGECVLDDGVMNLSDSDPMPTNENGHAGIGIKIDVLRSNLPTDRGRWKLFKVKARVMGTYASTSVELPVEYGDNEVEQSNQGVLKPGKLWVP